MFAKIWSFEKYPWNTYKQLCWKFSPHSVVVMKLSIAIRQYSHTVPTCLAIIFFHITCFCTSFNLKWYILGFYPVTPSSVLQQKYKMSKFKMFQKLGPIIRKLSFENVCQNSVPTFRNIQKIYINSLKKLLQIIYALGTQLKKTHMCESHDTTLLPLVCMRVRFDEFLLPQCSNVKTECPYLRLCVISLNELFFQE